MNTTKLEKCPESFEQVLLSYVDMCYVAARALTRNPDEARNLTREVLVSTWYRQDNRTAGADIKGELLSTLRNKFLQNYRINGQTFPAHAGRTDVAPRNKK